MSAPVLEVAGARCALGGRPVLDGVDLTVAPGELLALLGPNGAGKTTLLRVCSGRVRLREGIARVAGRNPLTDKVARRLLGIVPQTIALYPQLTARENLSVFARLLGLRGNAQDKAVELGLRRAGLQHRGDDRVVDLSGGMQRRLNIVAGALHAPRLMLLDEPTVGVDPTAREAIHALLDELRAAGIGMLLITHDLEQASSLADRVAFMQRGRVIAEGSVSELVEQVFGTAQELVVVLDAPAVGEPMRLLETHELTPLRDGRLWSGALKGGIDALPEFEHKLSEAGLHAVEIRLREPGLAGVYLHVTGEEFVP